MSVRTAMYGANTDELTAASSDALSLIDRESSFDGTFSSSRDMRIEGQVKGTVDCHGMLFIAEGANVSARVEADHIAVAGELTGDVVCRGRLQILSTGRVRGKISTGTLVIDEGAFYEGQLEMSANGQSAASAPRPVQSTASRGGAEPANPSTFIRRLGGPETPWQGDEPEEGES